MKPILLCLPLAAFAAYVTAYSYPSLLLPMFGCVSIAALLGTVIASVWFVGKWHDRVQKAGKVVLPATAAIYLLGYFYGTLSAII